MKNSDMPAMPQSVAYSESGQVTASYDFVGGQGLTKREHFAGLAMQALLSNPEHDQPRENLAISSVGFADALLKELEK